HRRRGLWPDFLRSRLCDLVFLPLPPHRGSQPSRPRRPSSFLRVRGERTDRQACRVSPAPSFFRGGGVAVPLSVSPVAITYAAGFIALRIGCDLNEVAEHPCRVLGLNLGPLLQTMSQFIWVHFPYRDGGARGADRSLHRVDRTRDKGATGESGQNRCG